MSVYLTLIDTSYSIPQGVLGGIIMTAGTFWTFYWLPFKTKILGAYSVELYPEIGPWTKYWMIVTNFSIIALIFGGIKSLISLALVLLVLWLVILIFKMLNIIRHYLSETISNNNYLIHKFLHRE